MGCSEPSQGAQESKLSPDHPGFTPLKLCPRVEYTDNETDLCPASSQALLTRHTHGESYTDRKHFHHFRVTFSMGGDPHPSFDGFHARRCRLYLQDVDVDGTPMRALAPRYFSDPIVEDYHRTHTSMGDGR